MILSTKLSHEKFRQLAEREQGEVISYVRSQLAAWKKGTRWQWHTFRSESLTDYAIAFHNIRKGSTYYNTQHNIELFFRIDTMKSVLYIPMSGDFSFTSHAAYRYCERMLGSNPVISTTPRSERDKSLAFFAFSALRDIKLVGNIIGRNRSHLYYIPNGFLLALAEPYTGMDRIKTFIRSDQTPLQSLAHSLMRDGKREEALWHYNAYYFGVHLDIFLNVGIFVASIFQEKHHVCLLDMTKRFEKVE